MHRSDVLKLFEEKLDKLLLILLEFKHLKVRIQNWRKKHRVRMSESLQLMQIDMNELKDKLEPTTASL